MTNSRRDFIFKTTAAAIGGSSVDTEENSKLAGPVIFSEFLGKSEDASAALKWLLATGRDIIIDGQYNISEELVIEKEGQIISGANGSTLKMLKSGMTALTIKNSSEVTIRDINIRAGGSRKSVAIHILNSDNCEISNCTIFNHGIGFKLNGARGCFISRNLFFDAALNEDFGFSSSSDIYVFNNSENNTIKGNICNSNGGYAIQLRTDAETYVNNCLISENFINGYNSYGIMLYKHDNGPINGCIISSNSIKNITGKRPNSPRGNDRRFGAAIYLLGAENFIVNNNNIERCNILTNEEILAPAGIGIASSGTGIVAGNIIKDVAWYGIYINDSNSRGASDGEIIVSNNRISNCEKSGIKIVARSGILIEANTIFLSSMQGIYITPGKSKEFLEDIVIVNNVIKNAKGDGVVIVNSHNFMLNANNILKCGLHGLGLYGCRDISIVCNKLSYNSIRGLDVDDECSGELIISGNSFLENGVVNAVLNAPNIYGPNINRGHRKFSGRYYPGFVLDQNNSTPNIGQQNYVVISPADPLVINDLIGASEGHVITIISENDNATIDHGKSIRLAGGRRFTMSPYSSIILKKIGKIWIELSRSIVD